MRKTQQPAGAGYRRLVLGLCVTFAAVYQFASVCRAAEAGDNSASAESLVSPQSWLTVSLRQPWRLAENAMIQQFYATALQSQQIQAAINSDQTDLYRELMELVAQSTGEIWSDGLRQLTAGGVFIGVSGDNPPRIDVAVAAQNDAVLAKFIPQLEAWLLGRVAPQLAGQTLPSKTYGDVSYRELGEARYAVVGKLLLMSNREEGLHELIDRCRERQTSAAASESATAAEAVDPPIVQFKMSGDKIRSAPNLQMPLAWPASDANLVGLLGGWLDAVRRCDSLDVSFRATSASLDIDVDLPHSSAATGAPFQETAGLEGYFAPVDGPGLAPLLKPEGTIYSSSWYRDYRSLWNNRSHAVTPEVLKRVDDGDELTKTQFSQFGVTVPLSELLSTLGPQFRSVIARQYSSPYQVELDEQFPAGAIVIRLQDEDGFRWHFIPLLKTLNLIAMFSQTQMVTKSDKYRDVDLNSLLFADDEQAVSKGNLFRFHFSPTFAISHGHFLWGSSVDLVKRLIDELDNESSAASLAAPAAGTTEMQFLSTAEVEHVLQELRKQIVYRLLIGQGLSKVAAESELDLFSQALKSIGTVTTTATRSAAGFEYQLHIEHSTRASE
ncbi:MAG: hypothetical protein WD065_06355 [Planctomycetaceae bacterium]